MSNSLTLTVPDGTPYIDFEREFDFPVELVFQAHARADMIGQWLGPRRNAIEVEHWDFRTGGSYLYRHAGPDGASYTFSGVFHTVRENDFAIQTFEFGGYPDVVSIEFLTFKDLGGGRCKLIAHSVYPTQEARDGIAASGMEEGMREAYERLEEVLSASRV